MKRLGKNVFAIRMRRKPTQCETLMHNALIEAFRPYRVTLSSQEVIGPYIADFFLAPDNIVVQVDGGYHRQPDQIKYDKSRDTYMRNRGIRVVKFTNAQVAQNPSTLAEQIKSMCHDLKLTKDTVKVTHCPPMRASNYRMRKRPEFYMG